MYVDIPEYLKMATINLIPNQRKVNKIHESKRNSVIHKTVYNTNTWRKLRINYLMVHPICEQCNNQLAIDVHHIIEISTGRNEFEMQRIGFDETNLAALCPECHKSKHNKQIK